MARGKRRHRRVQTLNGDESGRVPPPLAARVVFKNARAARIHFDVFRLIRTINGLTR
jgi:hypothetical protein